MELFEAITSNRGNKKFWLVFNLPESDTDERDRERLDGIARGVLKGVKGISSSRVIMTEWWVVGRNAALVMDADELLAMNDVSEVHYDDPDWLCRDGMKPLYRIFNQRRESKGSSYNVLNSVWRYVYRAMGDKWDHFGNNLQNVIPRKFEEMKPHIDSVADLEAFLIDAIKSEDQWGGDSAQRFLEEFDGAVHRGLLACGKIYSSEAEWFVNSDELRAPAGSTLVIAREPGLEEEAAKWRAEKEAGDAFADMHGRRLAFERILGQNDVIDRYHLEQRYIIRYGNSERFMDIRGKVVVRRREKTLGNRGS